MQNSTEDVDISACRTEELAMIYIQYCILYIEEFLRLALALFGLSLPLTRVVRVYDKCVLCSNVYIGGGDGELLVRVCPGGESI